MAGQRNTTSALPAEALTAKTWNPGREAKLSGELLSMTLSEPHPEYGVYPILTLRVDADHSDADESWTVERPYVRVHAFSKLQMDALKDIRPGLGTTLTFVYGGHKTRTPEERAAGKRDYGVWSVFEGLDAKAQTIDWSAL